MQIKDLFHGSDLQLLDSLLSAPEKDNSVIAEIQAVIDKMCEPLPGFIHVNNAPEDTVEYVASKVKALYGYDTDFVRKVGKDIMNYFHPDDWGVANQWDENGELISHDNYSNFYRLKHFITGEWCWIHGQYFNLTYTPEGDVWYFLGYGVDISTDVDLGNIPQFARHLLALARQEALAELTRREREVLTKIAEGCTDIQIAQRLFISTHTAATHRRNLLRKLGVRNTAGLVKVAIMHGLVSV